MIQKKRIVILPILSILLSLLILEFCFSAEPVINYDFNTDINYSMGVEINYDTRPIHIQTPVTVIKPKTIKPAIKTNQSIKKTTSNKSRLKIFKIFR